MNVVAGMRMEAGLRRRNSRHGLFGLLLVAVLGTACGSGQPAAAEPPAAVPEVSRAAPRNPRPATTGYDLAADEALGGHTLRRHVGKSDVELADRLSREPDISAASTYTDLETAGRVVAATVASARGRLTAWSARSGPRPNLVLTYRDPGAAPIGRSLARGRSSARPCSTARVIIRWQGRAGRWIVLTSYPEAG